jgi:hypothetical protein
MVVPRRVLIALAGAPILAMLGCSEIPIPIPDEFDAAFVKGTVCTPADAHAGAEGEDPETVPGNPITFETCLYRCLKIELGSVYFRWYAQWSGSSCQIVPLITAYILKVDNESDCDGRYIEDPPDDECYPEQYSFDYGPVHDDGEFRTGDCTIVLPHLDMDAAERVLDAIDAGQSTKEALKPEFEHQNYPERQFVVNLSPDHPAITEDDLTSADCHDIPAP